MFDKMMTVIGWVVLAILSTGLGFAMVIATAALSGGLA